MMSLDTLAIQIRANLEDAQSSDMEYKWQRAGLYRAAREHFRADRAFGEWLDNNVRSTGTGLPKDSDNVIRKLIMCATHLTQEQFSTLRYTRAVELMVKATIENQPDLWRTLITYVLSENKDYKFIREAMKEVKAGTWNPEPPQEEEEPTPEAPVAFTEGSFFSPIPEVRSLQEFRLTQDLGYCAQLLELPSSANNTWVEAEIVQAFRRAATKYHPDHGGSDGDMQWVNFAKDNLIESISLISQIRQIRGE